MSITTMQRELMVLIRKNGNNTDILSMLYIQYAQKILEANSIDNMCKLSRELCADIKKLNLSYKIPVYRNKIVKILYGGIVEELEKEYANNYDEFDKHRRFVANNITGYEIPTNWDGNLATIYYRNVISDRIKAILFISNIRFHNGYLQDFLYNDFVENPINKSEYDEIYKNSINSYTSRRIRESYFSANDHYEIIKSVENEIRYRIAIDTKYVSTLYYIFEKLYQHLLKVSKFELLTYTHA